MLLFLIAYEPFRPQKRIVHNLAPIANALRQLLYF